MFWEILEGRVFQCKVSLDGIFVDCKIEIIELKQTYHKTKNRQC